MKIALQTFSTLTCLGLIWFDIIVFVYSFDILQASGVGYLIPFYVLFCAIVFITIKVIEVTYILNKSFNEDNK